MTPPPPADLARRIVALMERSIVPGVALGLVDGDGESLHGWGLTNVDHPLPVDADTVFEIASITKTMTATVAARLAADGRLDLDAPVRRYLADFRVADDAVSEHVTVRDLFTHTAGWFGEYLPHDTDGPDGLAAAVASLATLEQVSPRGVFSYNNVSLTVAGRVIEVVAGGRYVDVMRELLFAPLAMTRSTFDPRDVLYERLAAGHTVRDGKPVRVRARLADGHAGDPAGGVRSTVRDLLGYARFHIGDGSAPDGARVLPAGDLAAMRAPRVATGTGGHVGLSWMLEERGGTVIASHGGATVAHMSQLVLVPARGAAFVILTNGANGARLCAELGEWLLQTWLGLPARAVAVALAVQPDLALYAGRYQAPLSDIDLAPEGGGLVLRLTWKGSVAERPPPPLLQLAFTAPDIVRAVAGDPPPTGDFIRDADGAIAYLRWGGRARLKVGQRPSP